jgi:hypothetical protein
VTVALSLSPPWIAASTPDTVPATPFPLVKRLHRSTKVVQGLIAARATLAKQRWSSVQEFCVGLADPSVHELASSGAKLCMGVGGAGVNFAKAENILLIARNILCSSKLSER